MKKWNIMKKVGIMGHYLLSYTLALLLAGLLIAAVFLIISAKQVVYLELDYWERSLERTANELEAQQELLGDIHARMMISYSFQPTAIAKESQREVSGEIELLEEITAYTTQSPISDEFFVLYAGNSNIYLSTGYKSRFSYYFQARIYCTDTEAMTIYDEIQQLSSFAVLPVSENSLLFVYPVRFPSSRTMAWTCFWVARSTLEGYLEGAANGSTEQFIVYCDETAILEKGELLSAGIPDLLPGNTARIKDGTAWRLSARSEDGQFTILAEIPTIMLSNYPHLDTVWIGLIIVLVLLAILLLATCFAYVTSRPIRSLSARITHAPVTGNELEVIDKTFSQLENEKNISVKNLRNQIVLSLLDGNYSPELLRCWNVFQISLNAAHFAVFLVKTAGRTEESVNLARQIEAISDEDFHLYAACRNDLIEVIANFEDASQVDTINDCIQALADQVSEFTLYTGDIVDSPYKINISHLTGLAQMQQYQRSGKASASTLLIEDRGALIAELCAVASNRTNEKQLDAALEKLRRYVQKYAPSLLIQKHLCYELLNQIMRCAQENHADMDPQKISELLMIQNFDVFLRDFRELVLEAFPIGREDQQTALSEEILGYIQQNACDCNLSVDRVTGLFHITPVQLNDIVKQQTAVCFKEYVTYLRMKTGMELLLSEPEMTVNKISCICGYNKPSNFIKKFKEFTGQTPTQYRRRETGSLDAE